MSQSILKNEQHDLLARLQIPRINKALVFFICQHFVFLTTALVSRLQLWYPHARPPLPACVSSRSSSLPSPLGACAGSLEHYFSTQPVSLYQPQCIGGGGATLYVSGVSAEQCTCTLSLSWCISVSFGMKFSTTLSVSMCLPARISRSHVSQTSLRRCHALCLAPG